MLGDVPRVIAIVFLIAIVIYAFMLAVRSPQDKMPGGINKWLWAFFTLVPPVLGSIIFLVAFYVTHSKGSRGAAPDFLGPRDSRRQQSGPLAPDDDPDFLKKLDDELRRQSYDKRLRDHENEGHRPDQHETDENDEEGKGDSTTP